MNNIAKRNYTGIIYTFFLFIFLFLLLFNIKTVIAAVREAMKMCADSIVPSLFPFMIVSDMLISSSGNDCITEYAGRIFEKVFKISRYAVSAFILGILCGFPIGSKVCASLYQNGKISKEECETAVCFCNNTSPSFVIGAIGVTMLSDVKTGITLYLIQILSSVICGLFLSHRKRNCTYFDGCVTDTKYNSFIDSVKDSACNMLFLSALIITFSLIAKILLIYIKSDCFSAFFCAFLEIGTASKTISTMLYQDYSFFAPLMAFAVSFSGFSVYMQTCIFLKPLKINTNKYLISKFAQGLMSAFFMLLHTFLS